jgi:hypothetical protein
MAQSLTSLLAHIVFGTKNRIPYLDDEINHELYLYIEPVPFPLFLKTFKKTSINQHSRQVIF